MTTRKNNTPDFQSREAEAAWIEAHIAEAWADAKSVNVRFAKNLSAGLNIRLDPENLEQLRMVVRDKGIGPTTLARIWLLEQLKAARRWHLIRSHTLVRHEGKPAETLRHAPRTHASHWAAGASH